MSEKQQRTVGPAQIVDAFFHHAESETLASHREKLGRHGLKVALNKIPVRFQERSVRQPSGRFDREKEQTRAHGLQLKEIQQLIENPLHTSQIVATLQSKLEGISDPEAKIRLARQAAEAFYLLYETATAMANDMEDRHIKMKRLHGTIAEHHAAITELVPEADLQPFHEVMPQPSLATKDVQLQPTAMVQEMPISEAPIANAPATETSPQSAPDTAAPVYKEAA